MLRTGAALLVAAALFGLDNRFAVAAGGTSEDYARGIAADGSGGFIVAGGTSGYGAGFYDLLVSKVDLNGSLVWSRTVGGANWDYGRGVTLGSDGGSVVVGETKSFGAGMEDMLLVKLDGMGSLLWATVVGAGFDDHGEAVCTGPSGGYFAAGYTSNTGAGSDDILLCRFDSLGVLVWARALGGPFDERAFSVAYAGGRVITAAWTENYGAGDRDILVSVWDTSGNHLFSRSVGGSFDEHGYSVALTPGGRILVAGYTESFGAGGRDILLACLQQRWDAPLVTDSGRPGQRGGLGR